MFSFLIRWLSFAAGENRLEFRIMIQPIKTHVYLRRPRESVTLEAQTPDTLLYPGYPRSSYGPVGD